MASCDERGPGAMARASISSSDGGTYPPAGGWHGAMMGHQHGETQGVYTWQ